jgi:hypothetical protein
MAWKQNWGGNWGGQLSKECHSFLTKSSSDITGKEMVLKKYIFNNNDWKLRIEFFGGFLLHVKTGFVLVLNKTAIKIITKAIKNKINFEDILNKNFIKYNVLI